MRKCPPHLEPVRLCRLWNLNINFERLVNAQRQLDRLTVKHSFENNRNDCCSERNDDAFK